MTGGRRREEVEREGDAEGPIVMGVTIESGVSIVNQYPDTAAGASYAPRVPACRYIRQDVPSIAVGRRNTRF